MNQQGLGQAGNTDDKTVTARQNGEQNLLNDAVLTDDDRRVQTIGSSETGVAVADAAGALDRVGLGCVTGPADGEDVHAGRAIGSGVATGKAIPTVGWLCRALPCIDTNHASYSAPCLPIARSSSSNTVTLTPLGVANE